MIPEKVRTLLRSSIDELLKDIEPSRLMGRFLFDGGLLLDNGQKINIDPYRNIYLIAGGKASLSMIEGIKPLIPYLKDGVAVYSDSMGFVSLPENIRKIPSSHPVPTEKSINAGLAIKAIAEKAGKEDLVLCLISGGLSAMAEVPLPGLTLKDISERTDEFLKAGADIHQLNGERKKLSQIKGGKLAELAYPADIISYILSDVPGNDLSTVGSGMTVSKGKNPEVNNILIGSNETALLSLEKYFSSKGFKVFTGSSLSGEAKTCAAEFVQRFHSLKTEGPCCFISGGETTVKVEGDGKGGRNQEFALAAALALEGTENTFGYSFGTDGVDGPTDAGGAFFSSSTVKNRGIALDHLRGNNSYNFFKDLNDLILTGPTGTNVMDVVVVLKQ